MTLSMRTSMTKLIICFGAALLSLAAFGAPVRAEPAGPALESLKVSVWPEYDQPSVLVMYRGRLAADVKLPATVRFFIPKKVRLSSTSSINSSGEFEYDRAWKTHQVKSTTETDELSYEVDSRDFQFELYMKPVKGGGPRHIDFDFLPSVNIGEMMVEVQKPARAQKFKLEPASNQASVDKDGLETHLYQFKDLKPEEKLKFLISYEKPDARPSITPGDTPGAARPRTLALAIVAAFAVLLIVLWRVRVATMSAPQARPTGNKKNKKNTKNNAGQAKYCPACGETVGKKTGFCANCGEKIRK